MIRRKLSLAIVVFEITSRVAVVSAQGADFGCVGDCDSSQSVDVSELVTGVNDMLHPISQLRCAAMDANGDGQVRINELMVGARNALDGCPRCPPISDVDLGVLYEVIEPSVFIDSTPDGLVSRPLAGSFRLIDRSNEENIELGFDVRAVRLCAGSDVTIEEVSVDPGFLGFFGTVFAEIPLALFGAINDGPELAFSGQGPFSVESNGDVILDGVYACSSVRTISLCREFPLGGGNSAAI